ncbi:MAG: hypothetical protein LUQ12_03285 [Methanoregulaceae archaeon]|nr:hypothetical protein [Methanoregulaceae archaeon]
MEKSNIAVISALITCCLLFPVVAAQETGDGAAAQITVSGVDINPGIFFEGDTGIITIEVVNNGPESVAIRRATMYDSDISVISSSYDTTTTVGAGNRMQFTFTVKADVPPGIYYPSFSLDFRDAGYLRYPVQIRVENDPLAISVLDKPDTFSAGRKDRIDITVGNPRDNPVGSVIVYFRGKSVEPAPSSYFIGTLNPDQAQKISFNITPGEPTNLDIVVDYKNGVNPHSAVTTLPVAFGESKKQAEPILSNIIVEYKDGKYTLTGDVTNAGLEVANSVVLSAGDGAEPVNPYREYVVGSLQPDDFASFEITFLSENTAQVQVIVNYRDEDGNPSVRTTPVVIPPKTSAKENSPGVSTSIIAVILISAAVIGGAIWYSWKKR